MTYSVYSYATKGWPICKGCSPLTSCAPRCWAARECHRLADNPNQKIAEFHRGLTDEHGHWTGTVRLNEAHLTDPLRWRKPAVIATGYHGDLFRLPPDQIDRVFAVILACRTLENVGPHDFLLLSKCSKEMGEYFTSRTPAEMVKAWALAGDGLIHINGGNTWFHEYIMGLTCHDWDANGTNSSGSEYRPWGYLKDVWPPPGVFLGFSASNQSEFDARAPHVLRLAEQGWKTWVSLEPLTGPVDVSKAVNPPHDEVQVGEEEWLHRDDCACNGTGHMPRLSQVVLGGESGKDARPMSEDWVRAVRDQCAEASVPFFYKQNVVNGKKIHIPELDGRTHDELAWEVGR